MININNVKSLIFLMDWVCNFNYCNSEIDYNKLNIFVSNIDRNFFEIYLKEKVFSYFDFEPVKKLSKKSQKEQSDYLKANFDKIFLIKNNLENRYDNYLQRKI